MNMFLLQNILIILLQIKFPYELYKHIVKNIPMYSLTAKVAKTSASFHYLAGNTFVVLLLCITLERREGKTK
jgi:hypothetical protein